MDERQKAQVADLIQTVSGHRKQLRELRQRVENARKDLSRAAMVLEHLPRNWETQNPTEVRLVPYCPTDEVRQMLNDIRRLRAEMDQAKRRLDRQFGILADD